MEKQNTPNKKRLNKIQKLKKIDNFCESMLDFIIMKPIELIGKIFSKLENFISIMSIIISFSTVLLGIRTIMLNIMGYTTIQLFESIFCVIMGIILSIMSIQSRISILIKKES